MPTSSPWVDTAKLRALFRAGLTYDEIADINFRSTGYRPTRSGVAKKFERLGFPPRRPSHSDLIPWRIDAAHNSDRLRHMLQAESRKRQGIEISDKDRTLVALLHELLFGRGRFLVVGYDKRIGFYLTERHDADEDIIRMPNGNGDTRGSEAVLLGKNGASGAPPLLAKLLRGKRTERQSARLSQSEPRSEPRSSEPESEESARN